MALLLIFFLVLASTTPTTSSTTAELTIPINKTCSNQIVQNPTTNITLDALFATLVDISNSTNFFQATIINTAITVNGLYRCSANLTLIDCKTCVQNLATMIPTPCNTATAKLLGCYMTYEVVENHIIYSDGGEDYGGCIGAFVASVVATVVFMLLQS